MELTSAKSRPFADCVELCFGLGVDFLAISGYVIGGRPNHVGEAYEVFITILVLCCRRISHVTSVWNLRVML
jgi:hypothetical protein